jgi:hypothetical protein
VIDRITFEPDFPRYCCTCHWSGNGMDPKFFNNSFETAQRDDLPWTRVVNAKPRRLAYLIKCDDWEATQVERSVVVTNRTSGKVVRRIRIPTAWDDEWGWNFIDGGILVEQTRR